MTFNFCKSLKSTLIFSLLLVLSLTAFTCSKKTPVPDEPSVTETQNALDVDQEQMGAASEPVPDLPNTDERPK